MNLEAVAGFEALTLPHRGALYRSARSMLGVAELPRMAVRYPVQRNSARAPKMDLNGGQPGCRHGRILWNGLSLRVRGIHVRG